MYQYRWDPETRGIEIIPDNGGVIKPIRPVYFEELDLLGLNLVWQYPKSEAPLLWAEGARKYYYDGSLVAETIGGGYYTEPEIKVYQNDLTLDPVNVDVMVKKNRIWLQGIEQEAISYVYDVWKQYKDKADVVYVAYSGGKDSDVTLDIVQRALAENDFVVVFGDTRMELSDTYDTYNNAKQKYPQLKFFQAASELSPQETWALFGPPARKQRWCCCVHKSTPSLLKLSSLIPNLRHALVFDGVRADESVQRATYERLTEGGKHAIQTNVSPIQDWNTAEVFLYIFTHKLCLNVAYRKGMTRVGCMACPMSSRWSEYLMQKQYGEQLAPFLHVINDYAKDAGIADNKINGYIDAGNWKARIGGRGLRTNDVIIDMEQTKETIVANIDIRKRVMFDNWLWALGKIEPIDNTTLLIHPTKTNGKFYPMRYQEENRMLRVEFLSVNSNQRSDLIFQKYLKGLVKKAAFCIGCGACAVECKVGALKIGAQDIQINKSKCIHCLQCFELPHSCLRAKSLYITKGGNKMYNGMNRYQTFGFRRNWLQKFNELGMKLFDRDDLGKYQKPALKVWLRESKIIDLEDTLPLGGLAAIENVDNTFVWACIWINLCYNSALMRWYIDNVAFGSIVTKAECIQLCGDSHVSRTNENAINSLFDTMSNSPIGTGLGLGICEMKGKVIKNVYKRGWLSPDPLAILYALYRFAEHEGNRYKFTLEQLDDTTCNEQGLSPQQLFGLDSVELQNIVTGLASQYPNFINVSFAMGLDNIDLHDDKTAEDILVLYQRSASI